MVAHTPSTRPRPPAVELAKGTVSGGGLSGAWRLSARECVSAACLQGVENMAALDEGSVLCTETRALLGRIEDVLGPVTQPVYAVRYCGAGALPGGLAARDRVFAVAGRSRVFDASAAATAGPPRDWDAAVEGEEESDEEGGEVDADAAMHAPEGASGKRQRDEGRQRPNKVHGSRGGRGGGRGGGCGGRGGGRGGGGGPRGIVGRVTPGQQPCAPCSRFYNAIVLLQGRLSGE